MRPAKFTLNARTVESARPADKPYELRDHKQPGLLLRVQPSGVKSFVVRYARNKRTTIGKAPAWTVGMAREKAKKIMAHGGPLSEDEMTMTLGEFIDEHYRPYALEHNRTGYHLVQRIERAFGEHFDKPLDQITPWIIDKWRTKRLKERKPGTVNRDVGALKSALSRAVEWGLLDDHPLKSIKPKPEDKRGVVRYLSEGEEKRLRSILDAREARLRNDRDNGNTWRRVRGYAQREALAAAFADHIKPMVLLSINTGLRRGELFGLRWEDVDVRSRTVSVRGSESKTAQSRSIPLSNEAVDVLREWKRQQCDKSGYVFIGRTGGAFNNTKKAWTKVLTDAGIENFRWHDLRHHFASTLVMGGVDLYTVSQLLGHSSIEITRRYAHLAPKHLADAVAVLNR